MLFPFVILMENMAARSKYSIISEKRASAFLNAAAFIRVNKVSK